MKTTFARIFFTIFFLPILFTASAQNNFFRDLPESNISRVQQRLIIPAKYRTISLNRDGLKAFFNNIPSEKALYNRLGAPLIEVPLPDGGVARFRIWESSVMDPQLAAKFPEIKTFTGQGIDDPTANIKLDWTPAGFHAMIISSVNGAVFIDPYAKGNTGDYISYKKSDFTKKKTFNELPLRTRGGAGNRPASTTGVLAGSCIGAQLRTFRLALAANAEYTTFHGGTVAGAVAAQATTLNRINGVFERELGIRMVLVSNNSSLVYTNVDSDPYTNDDPDKMLDENQANIDAVIGNANYDIGHVFTTGGGGVAVLGGLCVPGYKAQGVTGTNAPVGDPFDIDYVAHELGHQFGANHTYNSTTSSCNNTNQSFTTNAEPGSGSTIMGYAGICGLDNLQNHSDAQFHAVSQNEILNNIINGNGSTCAVVSSTGNAAPVVNAGGDFIIPKSTAFILAGTGSDPNGDVLTYSWEQMDVGGPFGAWDDPSGDAPLFRSFVPASTPTRLFPALSDVLANATTKGELLPSYARILHFRLTARDNRAGGGGTCFDETNITVNGTAGPFLVTAPNTAGLVWYVNDFKTITWDPAGTSVAPINCTNVKIELSTDGGLSYSTTLVASTANDGSEEIQVPAILTNKARIRIVSVGNVFYDVSNFNLAIQNSPASEFVFNTPATTSICNVSSVTVNLKTASLNSFVTPINLTASGNPAGTTVSFSANPLNPGQTTVVTLGNTAGLAAGTYNVTVNGVAGSINKSTVLAFLVNPLLSAPQNLVAPANNAIGVGILPTFNWSPVTSAATYTLELSTSSDFSPLSQTVTGILSLPHSLVSPLLENTVYYWRVRGVNSCGNGAVSATGVFKTGNRVCSSSTDVPKAISAGAAATITSTLTIPANAGVTILDLNVTGLKGTHNYLADLTIQLTSPAGTTVTLFDKICDSEQNFDLNLDDEATMLSFPCPPVGGATVKPQSALSAFDGQSSAGTWTLTVIDNEDQDGGSLNGWGLCFLHATPISNAPAWTQLCPATASTALTSNITGNTYQWQVNTGTGFSNISNNANYAGTNTGTLTLSNVPSSWNGYQFRSVVDGNNSNVYTLGFTNYWNGSVSNAWENPQNWSCNAIPDAYTDVYITSGSVVVNSAGICRSLRVSNNATVTVNTGFTITVTH